MKNQLSLLLLLISIISFSQEVYYVNAPSGLIIRDQPNGNRYAKLPYGSKAIVKKKLQTFSVADNGKTIEGNWVELDHKNGSQIIYDDNIAAFPDKAIAFNGFLISESKFITQKEQVIAKHSALKDYYLATSYESFALKGDFFGDGIEDDLFRMIDTNGNVRLIVLNHQHNGTKIYGLGGAKDPFNMESYSLEILYKIPKGTPLWSNYTDDYREFKNVPKNEIVKLNYDAIYMHNAEACGGGFIFWKNNKWNWLQQE